MTIEQDAARWRWWRSNKSVDASGLKPVDWDRVADEQITSAVATRLAAHPGPSREEQATRIALLESAIRWALGYEEGEPQFREKQPGDPAYWWRKELIRRAELSGWKIE